MAPGASSPRCGVGGSCQHGRGAPPMLCWCPGAAPWLSPGLGEPQGRGFWDPRPQPHGSAGAEGVRLQQHPFSLKNSTERVSCGWTLQRCPCLTPRAPPALQLWDVGAPAGLLGRTGSSQPVALPGTEPPHPGCRRRALTSRPPSWLQPPGLPLGISPSTAALRCPGPGGTFPAPAHGTAPQPSPRLCQ